MGEVIGQIRKAVDSPMVRVVAVSIASAVTWFLWAYWANREDPSQALTSGLFQGGVNFITTSFGSTGLEVLFTRFGRTLVGKVFSVLVVSSISLALMISAHLMANTPNMVLTILPVYIVVVLFCSSYIFGLSKLQKQYDQNEVAVS